MPVVDYTDALDANWVIFPLQPIINGQCGCGDEECKAVGKHPKDKGWQNTQPYDEHQLEYLEDHEDMFLGNQLLNNYGVLVKDLLVVDVDQRNGGVESIARLNKDLGISIEESALFSVQTGSGGASAHHYFRSTEPLRLKQTLHEYPGIDFKSSGFVVGSYSEHASGIRYEAIKGMPKDVEAAPAELLTLLKQEARESFSMDIEPLSSDEIAKVVNYIPNTKADYEFWIRVGMGIHHATGGTEQGYALWVKWSEQCDEHDEKDMHKKWASFSDRADVVTQGTLIAWAQEHGYVADVTFEDDTQWYSEEEQAAQEDNKATKHDMLNPPGLVGSIVNWINSRSMYPRERLAVAAALQIVSNACGLTHMVADTRTNLNLITLGIAGSRTGKGAIKKCIDEVHAALGLSPAAHGKFKSSQELVRNALYHQAVYYVYDEFGKQLSKISGASKGGAHYLEDLLADFIAMYSEASGTHGVSGDVKREMVEILERRLAAAHKKKDNANDAGKLEIEKEIEEVEQMMNHAERGIVEPYLTFIGFTEPSSFYEAIESDPWLLLGGFLGRALLFEELDNVPEKKPLNEVVYSELPEIIMGELTQMVSAGHAGGKETDRIERHGDWQYINWSEEALSFLSSIEMYWRDVALGEQDAGSGLESQALGAAELTIKVAGILAADTKVISRTDIEWAHELIKDITTDKIQRARSSDKITSKDGNERGSGMIEAIMRHIGRLDDGDYSTAGKVRQAIGRSKASLEDTNKALQHLVSIGKIKVQVVTAKNGRTSTRYTVK